jgi:CheY-like chemotaxis protein
MPDVDGFKVAETIRSIEKVWHAVIKDPKDVRHVKAKKPCPIVAITAFNSGDVDLQAKKVGICRVLTKPVNIVQIRAAIKDFYLS